MTRASTWGLEGSYIEDIGVATPEYLEAPRIK